MRKRKKKNLEAENNFWISYADLMAGLLFVFILVVGAVIMKYSYVTSELLEQKQSIEKLEKQAKQKQEAAEKLQKELEQQKKEAEEQKKEADKVKDELDHTKETIYKLTSIKTNVIKKLREKLGDKIAIDPKSGSLSIAGNILFDQNKHTLKDNARRRLTSILSEYIKVLMEDKEIRENLDRIIIEGHTNSDGTYVHNLELSQKRALEVMKFLLTLQPELESHLKGYVAASGRSETDLVIKSGKEDKFASRRIEIKFRLKNDEAMNEISKLLETK
ncbi:MAG: chemotaxis protein [Epsilonproteobacteria bacterium]|nr:MAG: chemotaxis protein [Campylobacterota bacterium]